MKKQLFALLLAVCVLMNIGAVSACAASTPSTSGKCGSNLRWNYDESTATLTISGEGPMKQYSSYVQYPWNKAWKNDVRHVVIEDGVTSIENHAFEY